MDLRIGTLGNHAEAGEELFEVALDEKTGDVTYRIRAMSWPHARWRASVSRSCDCCKRAFAEIPGGMKRAIKQPSGPSS